MNKNKFIASIKADMKRMFSVKKFSDFVLSDNTKITSPDSELTVDSEVYKVDDQGNQTPLDNGDYVIDDGRTISVKDNVITVIADAPAKEETPIEEPNTDMAEDAPIEETKEEGDLSSMVADMKADLEALAEIVQNLVNGQSKTNDEMMSAINKFSSEPGAQPIKTNKIGYQAYNKVANEPVSIEGFRAKLSERAKSVTSININK